MLSGDIPERVDEPITTLAQLMARGANPNYFPYSIQKSYCEKSIFGFTEGVKPQLAAVAERLPQEMIDYFVETCIYDNSNIDYGWFDKKFQFAGCGAAHMLAEEAEEAGVCIGEGERGSGCPSRKQIRKEAIRIGCIWTDEDFKIVSW